MRRRLCVPALLVVGACSTSLNSPLPAGAEDASTPVDNDAGAVSMTGLGESIIRIAVAKEIADRLAAGASPATATRLTLEKLVTRIKGGAGGALVLAPDGRFAIRHTTSRMCAGWWEGSGKPTVADRFRK